MSRGLASTLVLAGAVLVSLPLAARGGERAVTPPLRAHVVAKVPHLGISGPTAFRFSPDGRVFVALQDGRIFVLDRLGAKPKLFADLSREVFNFADHGLLGLALDPNFPKRPLVYVAYSYDAPIGGKAPRWGGRRLQDSCPNPPGRDRNGCVHSGRVSVLTARGDHMIGREHVLINDWCNQFDVHSVADVGFGPDGALYVSAGDGAGWNFTDYGERGDPPNPCGDPPGGVGAHLRPPTAEGGALRAQQLRASGRTALRHPMTLDGTVIRVDPRTGAALPGNPLASDRDPNARKIVAYGLKEPFRFVFRPGTHELWVTDVGAETWEEINRIPSPTERVQNFGWPCYENTEHTGDYYEKLQIATFDLCKSLYAQGPAAVTAPYFAYRHTEPIVKGEPCPRAANFITGIAFATHAPYPKPLDRALYFVDAGRGCAWALPLGRGGLPNAEHPILVATGLGGLITDMQVGPDGRLYVLDLGSGQISRLDAAAR